MRFLLVFAGLAAAAVAAGMFLRVGGDVSNAKPGTVAHGRDLSGYPDQAPPVPIDVVFLHHSVGQYMLAARGPEPVVADGLLVAHPNGGGLADLLRTNGYRLHDVTYGSELGRQTDLFDWLPKFRNHMDAILAARQQDQRLPDGERNRVVLFKSCFPNSEFTGRGSAGDPAGPELTEANARATMLAVRAELAKHPDVLFGYLTAPPVTPRTWPEPAWKWLVKRVTGRPTHDDEVRASGAIARDFNNWMADPQGWLANYPQRNIVVFDLFDTLTDHGASNFLRYPAGGGADSHPTAEGAAHASRELVAWLNRAVRYAGVVR